MDVFCMYHTETKENPLGTDCTAHLYERRVYKCPFTTDNLTYEPPFPNSKSGPQLMIRSFKQSKSADGVCRDFKALEGLEESLTEIAKENMKKLRK
jgi:hypothetical protein